jgi:hypothetical protein
MQGVGGTFVMVQQHQLGRTGFHCLQQLGAK